MPTGDAFVSSARADLLRVFQRALREVHGERCVTTALDRRPVPRAPCYVVAVGKAARAMYDGAERAWGGHISAALVITKHGHSGPAIPRNAGVRLLECGHPLADEASLRAGGALLAFLRDMPEDACVLFLLSGGASALTEVLPPELGLEDLRRAQQWLLASGLDIHAVNRVRRALSCIKGGRLARALEGRRTLQLLISDVPGDFAGSIGCGPLVPATETALPDLPPWLGEWVARAPDAPAPGEPCYAEVTTEIVCTAAHARAAAVAAARDLGYAAWEHGDFLSGDALARGREMGRGLQTGPPGVHVWSAETTLELPAECGRGGRCQSLALAAAQELAGAERVWLLAAGSDGTDGPTQDAGALVDGRTCVRGRDGGLDPLRCLAAADAGTFLEVSGDLIRTGPTGTNVMDLVLGLKL